MSGSLGTIVLEDCLIPTGLWRRCIKEYDCGLMGLYVHHMAVGKHRQCMITSFRNGKEIPWAKLRIGERSGRAKRCFKRRDIPVSFSRDGDRCSFGHRCEIDYTKD